MITVEITDDTRLGLALTKVSQVVGIRPELLGPALVMAAAKEVLLEAEATAAAAGKAGEQ